MNRTSIGKYSELQPGGREGLTEIYSGRDPNTNRPVLIKVIPPHLARTAARPDQLRLDFERLTSLNHPHIRRVIACGVEDGSPYLVVDQLEGDPLLSLVKRTNRVGKALSLERVAAILEGIAAGLDHAHDRGVLHGHLDSENIFLFKGQGEKPFLTDFGVLGLLDESAVLTVTGSLVGAVPFFPPERATGQPIDRRSDIYSLGIVLYQMLTGEVPFTGDFVSVMMQHVNRVPETPTSLRPEIPPATAQVVLKALAKNPEDRYQSAGAFACAFRESLWDPDATIVDTHLLKIPELRPNRPEPAVSGGDVESMPQRTAAPAAGDPSAPAVRFQWLPLLLGIAIGFVLGAIAGYLLAANLAL